MHTCAPTSSAAAAAPAAVQPQPVGPMFPLGRICATPGAHALLTETGLNGAYFLARHVTGDWSEMCADDQQTNHEAIKYGSRVFSSYAIRDGQSLWIITEADRSVTTLLLPSEY